MIILFYEISDCWAFSVIDALEGQQSKKMGYYVKLSPQHLTSCLKTTSGCNGGDTYRAVQEILTTPTKEVYTEASYPVNLHQIITEPYILYS